MQLYFSYLNWYELTEADLGHYGLINVPLRQKRFILTPIIITNKNYSFSVLRLKIFEDIL